MNIKSAKNIQESFKNISTNNMTDNNTDNYKNSSAKIDKKQLKKQTYSQVRLLGEGSYGKAFLVKCS